MPLQEQVICLQTTDYSETSQVVCFLTRGEGMVRVLAKGTKRPKSKSSGAIDLLSEGTLIYAASKSMGLGTLMEFSQTTGHIALRKEAGKLHAALGMLELTARLLAEGDPHPEVFHLLHHSLMRLEQADAPTAAVLAYFQWRLLRSVGLLGELRNCAACGRGLTRGAVYFSSSQGGLLCGDCEAMFVEKYRLEGPTMAGLAALQAAEKAQQGKRRIALPDKQAHAVNRLLIYHVTQQLGRPLKTARYILP